MSEEVVVAGAGFAGLNSALMLDSEGFDVTLIDRDSRHVFKPGLIELMRGRVSKEDITLDLENFLENTEIKFVEEEVTEIQPDRKSVETSGENFTYDYLVLALGSEKVQPDFDLRYTENFYTLEDAEKAVDELEDSDSAVVIGSGYTGVEIGTELHEKGLDVTVVDESTRPMPASREKVSQAALDHFNGANLSFRGGNRVSEVTNYGVELENGKEIEADTVIWCGGLQASKTVQKSFKTSSEGVRVNSGLSALEHEDIFVAGDSADDENLDTAQMAEKQGIHVAENIYTGGELLEDFEPGRNPVIVSLGNSGMMITENSVYRSRFVRFMKDMVIRYYFFNLRKRKVKSKIRSVKDSFLLDQ